MKFRAIQDGPDRSDCTAHYRIDILEKGTVKEFVEEVLKNTGEWGYINFYSSTRFPLTGRIRVEYRYGKLVEGEEILEKITNEQISSISGDGGWSCMDYTVILADF